MQDNLVIKSIAANRSRMYLSLWRNLYCKKVGTMCLASTLMTARKRKCFDSIKRVYLVQEAKIQLHRSNPLGLISFYFRKLSVNA